MATPEVAMEKLKYYCAYQERSHKEVLKKLHELKIWGHDAEVILAQLIQEDYLNEERYACSFTRGKYRMKQWGRVKIKLRLKQDQISAYCINKAMQEIDEEEYLETLTTLAKKKYESLKNEQYLRRKYKTRQYLIRKGYEPHLVFRIMEEVMK